MSRRWRSSRRYLEQARRALQGVAGIAGRAGLVRAGGFFSATNRRFGGSMTMIMSEPAATHRRRTRPPACWKAIWCAARGSGDLKAYDELVKRYQERIYATIYHMTSNHEDANDLAQESFIKAFQALKSFKGGSSFYTWLYRIAVNKTINFLKQRKNRMHMSLNDLDFNAEHDPDLMALISDKTPRRDAGLTELQEKLNEALLKLSEPHRLVVVLHDVQGLSHEEIAEIMDCNIGTVRSRLFYARQQLQGFLADYSKANMNENENNFETLRRLLKLKRHEIPPPGYFNNFSGQVIARIRAGEAGGARIFAERLDAEAPWLASLLRIFETKPGIIGGVCHQPLSAAGFRRCFCRPARSGLPTIFWPVRNRRRPRQFRGLDVRACVGAGFGYHPASWPAPIR